MIRILHTADWHFGHTFINFDRRHEHQHFLSWLKATLIKEDIDALLIAGDVFDVSNPSAQSQKMFYQFIQEVTDASPHLQIIVIAGNHDSASRLETPLPLLSDKRTIIKGVVTKNDSEIAYDELIYPLYNREGLTEAYCLVVPFLRQGDYPKVEAENAYAAGINALYTKLIERVATLKSDDQAVIAMGHMQTIGSEFSQTDHSEKFIIGGLEAISTSPFVDLNYTALGHIHKAQRLSCCEHIRYAGSPLPMSFAEKNYKHGVVKVVIDKGETLEISVLNYEPLVRMMSIPPKGFAQPEELFTLLADLPIKSADDDPSIYPFVEIKVQQKEPEPMLLVRLNEILADKAVRLARILNQYRVGGVSRNEEAQLLEGLQTLSPLDIAKQEFSDKYDDQMPQGLVDLFNEVCRDINIE